MGCCLCCCAKPSVSVTQQETLFQEKPEIYRIPALLYIKKSRTILAFAEQREGMKDESAKKIVMRRGTYDETKHTVKWEKMETVVEVSVKAPVTGHRPMNPCPVYDEVTGNIVLFFIAVEGNISEQEQISKKENKARLCQVTSTDNGLSWDPVKDLTDIVTHADTKVWATFAVGPGHGLQLNEDKSLVIPAYAYWISDNSTCTCPHPFCFVSDNHGQTWTRGNFLADKAALECQMVELRSQGEPVLYCNARSKAGARVQAVSYNKGRDFRSYCCTCKLVEPCCSVGCHGSVIGFPSPAGVQSEQDTWVLYSHPTNCCYRKDLGVYLNKEPLNPGGWSNPTVICKGYCAYSDLQYMEPGPDGSPLFCCLFEYGAKSDYEKIIFLMFTLKQVFPYEFGASEARPI